MSVRPLDGLTEHETICRIAESMIGQQNQDGNTYTLIFNAQAGEAVRVEGSANVVAGLDNEAIVARYWCDELEKFFKDQGFLNTVVIPGVRTNGRLTELTITPHTGVLQIIPGGDAMDTLKSQLSSIYESALVRLKAGGCPLAVEATACVNGTFVKATKEMPLTIRSASHSRSLQRLIEASPNN